MEVGKKNLQNARVLYYEIFGMLFIYNFHEKGLNNLDALLSQIAQAPLDSYSDDAIKKLLESIDFNSTSAISDEFNSIFYDPTSKHLGTSASYYEDGVEFSQKCLDVKNIIARTDIRRNEAIFKESEDSIGFIFMLMSNLIQNSNEELEVKLFKEILNPFIDTFTQNLYSHERADIYKNVAILLNSFMDFERLYFDVPKAKSVEKKRENDGISLAEQKRREANKARREADKKKNNKK